MARGERNQCWGWRKFLSVGGEESPVETNAVEGKEFWRLITSESRYFNEVKDDPNVLNFKNTLSMDTFCTEIINVHLQVDNFSGHLCF